MALYSPSYNNWNSRILHINHRGRRGHDRMVVEFMQSVSITTEFVSRSGRGVQHYMTNLSVSCDGSVVFLRVLRFPPPIKLTAMI